MCAPASRPTAPCEGHFQATGVRPRFLAELANQGIKIPGSYFDPVATAYDSGAMMLNFNPIYLFYLLIGVSAAMFAEGAYLLFSNKASYRKNINRRLKVMDDKPDRESVLVQLRRERGLTSGGEYRLPLINLNQLLLQSGLSIGFTRLIMFIAIGMAAAFVGTMMFDGKLMHAVVAALFCGPVLPILVLKLLRARRQKLFISQFPDAIDVITRSLRAGHPVPVAITMVAREMPDPCGTEFGIVIDEITYGADLETAMRNLYFRVGSDDLPLFVTAVAIQTLDRRQSRRNSRKPVGRDPHALQDAAQDQGAGRRRPRLGDDPVVAADRHVLRDLFPGAAFYASVWQYDLTKICLGLAACWMAHRQSHHVPPCELQGLTMDLTPPHRRDVPRQWQRAVGAAGVSGRRHAGVFDDGACCACAARSKGAPPG